jgi:hypothetical protein
MSSLRNERSRKKVDFFIGEHRWVRLIDPINSESSVDLGNKVPLTGTRKKIRGRTWVIVDQQRGHGLPEDAFNQALIEGTITLIENARTHEETTLCSR